VFFRFHALLPSGFCYHFGMRCRIVFYVFTYCSMIIIPVSFAFLNTPKDLQLHLLQELELDWDLKNRNFGVIYGVKQLDIVKITVISFIVNLAIFGIFLMLLLVITLRLASQSRLRTTELQYQKVTRARLKNSLVLGTQIVATTTFGLIPLLILVASIGLG
ncbi:hypothetical protein PENTCL1PPCAC_16969, partial [Pristionchus entomophagus]